MINICFRVDANHEVGMGHLMESISLANSLKKRADCHITFLIKSFPPATNILRDKGYQVELLNDGISQEDEIDTIQQLTKRIRSDILIFDLLNVDNRYFQKLKGHAKALAVILDDTEHRFTSADMVVNFNIAQDEEFYKKISAESGTIYCIGPKYMLLPDGLHEELKKGKAIPETCQTIFVNQGGSDPFGLTIRIIKALELLDLGQKIVVVIGPAVSEDNKRELGDMIRRLKNDYQFEWGIKQERVHQLIAESDMAITAAGNTLYELALFGVPSITVCHHERHNLVAQKFAGREAVINLGIGINLDIDLIADEVNRLLGSKEIRAELSANMRRIVDGLGSKRVAEKLIRVGT